MTKLKSSLVLGAFVISLASGSVFGAGQSKLSILSRRKL